MAATLDPLPYLNPDGVIVPEYIPDEELRIVRTEEEGVLVRLEPSPMIDEQPGFGPGRSGADMARQVTDPPIFSAFTSRAAYGADAGREQARAALFNAGPRSEDWTGVDYSMYSAKGLA